MTTKQEYDNAVNEMHASKLDAQVTMQALRAEFLEHVQAIVKKTGIPDVIACEYAMPDDEIVQDIDENHVFNVLEDDTYLECLEMNFNLAGCIGSIATLSVLSKYADGNAFTLVPELHVDAIDTDGYDEYAAAFKFMHNAVRRLDMIARYMNSKKFMSMFDVISNYAKLCLKVEKLHDALSIEQIVQAKPEDVIETPSERFMIMHITSKRIYYKSLYDGAKEFISKANLARHIADYDWKIVHEA